MDTKQIRREARYFIRGHLLEFIIMLSVWAATVGVLTICEELIAETFSIAYDEISVDTLLSVSGIRDIDSIIISAVFALLSFFFTTPINFGITRWVWYLTFGRRLDVGEIFRPFGAGMIGKLFRLRISVTVRSALWSLLVFSPALVCTVLASDTVSGMIGLSLTAAQMLTSCAMLLTLAGLALILLILPRYFMCAYLLIDKPEMTVRDIIRSSARMMRGMKGNLIRMYIGFIGWFFLCLLVIPIFYVAPMVIAAGCVFAKNVLWHSSAADGVQA